VQDQILMTFLRIRVNTIDFASPIRHGESFLAMDVFSPTFKFDPRFIDLEYDVSGDQSLVKPDFSEWVPGTLLLSQRAYGIIRVFLEECSVYQVTWGDDIYHLVFINKEIDAFDLAKSDYSLWSDEAKTGAFRVKHVKKIFLSASIRISADIFRLQGSLSLRMEIIFSRSLHRACLENSLTGLWFHQVG